MSIPAQSGRPNHERNTAAAPVRKALTFTITDTPSSANAVHVSTVLSFHAKSSDSKQLTNCAPPLLSESSAISRCSRMLKR